MTRTICCRARALSSQFDIQTIARTARGERENGVYGNLKEKPNVNISYVNLFVQICFDVAPLIVIPIEYRFIVYANE